MARTIDNAYLLSQWLQEKFGEREFTDEQFMDEVEDFLGLADVRTQRKYLHFSLKYEQIERLESGYYRASPKMPLTPKMKLARLKGQNKA
jgi:hypothetical protein